MSYGFMPSAIPNGRETEAAFNSIIIGDTIVSTLNITGVSVDWNHPDTFVAFANNLSNTLQSTGILEHGAEIWKP